MRRIPKVILLIKPEAKHERDFLLGISKYVHVNGPWAIFHEIEQRKRTWNYVKNWGADGVIADVREAQKLTKILGRKIPIIAIGTEEDTGEIPLKISNWEATARMGANHFLERGFRHFAFCSYEDFKWSRERGKTFCSIIEQAGFSVVYYTERYLSRQPWKNGQAALMKWLKSLPKPIGLMACNDIFGRHVVEACKFGQIHVPDEIAVLGVDNDEVICKLTDPPLSSISLDTFSAGYEAAGLLDRLMSGEKMSGQRIIAHPTHIEVRTSTDIFAIEDTDVVQALRFIRKNADKQTTVEQVADEICLSRRNLYFKFKQALGHSVRDEIKKFRIEQATRMLTETNLPISQIALKLGYPGIEKISRSFKKEKGVTPSEYRKKYKLR